MRTFDYAGGAGKTLAELRERIAGREREYVTAPLSALAVDGDSGHLVFGAFEAPMTPFAVDRLAHRVGMPGRYAMRIPTDLAAENFNRFLPATQGSVQLAVERVPGGQAVVGVLPERVSPVPLEALADHMAASMPRGFAEGQWRLSERGLVCRFVSEDVAAAPRPGDIVRAAVDLSDSENDTGLLNVSGALLRLVCSNGATVPAVTFGGRLRKESWREPHAIVAAAAAYFDEAVRGVGGYVAGLEELPTIAVDVPDEGAGRERAVRAADRIVGVPPSMSDAVSTAWRSEEPTLFGYHNSLTRLGRDSRDHAARARFEKAGFLSIVRRADVARAIAEAAGE